MTASSRRETWLTGFRCTECAEQVERRLTREHLVAIYQDFSIATNLLTTGRKGRRQRGRSLWTAVRPLLFYFAMKEAGDSLVPSRDGEDE